jgi:hypothetical protein
MTALCWDLGEHPGQWPLTSLITKNFIIAKDFCTYSIKILRQDKTRRDHRDRSRALRMTRVFGAAHAADEAYGERCPHRARARVGAIAHYIF